MMPISLQPGGLRQLPDRQYLHVAIEYLDGELAARLAEDYKVQGARFTTGAVTALTAASYPLLDRGGRVAAVFEWQPSQPGIDMLNRTGPVLGIAFCVAAILVVALVNRLWDSSAALESERLAAKR